MRVWVPVALALAMTLQTSGKPPLALVKTIELPRVEGRIDHLAFDTVGGKLFVAALGNNTVEVIDVEKAVHLTSLAGFREPQGIAIATDAGVVAIANGQGSAWQRPTQAHERRSSFRIGNSSTSPCRIEARRRPRSKCMRRRDSCRRCR